MLSFCSKLRKYPWIAHTILTIGLPKANLTSALFLHISLMHVNTSMRTVSAYGLSKCILSTISSYCRTRVFLSMGKFVILSRCTARKCPALLECGLPASRHLSRVVSFSELAGIGSTNERRFGTTYCMLQKGPLQKIIHLQLAVRR